MTDPYYKDESVTLYHGDCADFLPDIEPVALVNTDPPYSISVGVDHEMRRGKGVRRLNFFDGDTEWEEMTTNIVDRLMLALDLAPAHYVWCSHRQFGPIVEMFESEGFHTRFVVWRKKVAVPAPPGVGWDSAAELCIYAFRQGRQWVPPTGTKVPNVIEADSYRHGQPGKVDHPTQKPLATAALPILYSSSPGDVILDPFAGSGTTLYVAKREGRRAIGIEKNERHCETIAKRCAQGVLPL